MHTYQAHDPEGNLTHRSIRVSLTKLSLDTGRGEFSMFVRELSVEDQVEQCAHAPARPTAELIFSLEQAELLAQKIHEALDSKHPKTSA